MKRPSKPTVAGRYLTFSGGAFWFEYSCPRCGRKHRHSAPELSAPALCHGCVTGRRAGKLARRGARGKRSKNKEREP